MASTTSLGLGGIASNLVRAFRSAPAKGLPAMRYKKLLLVCKESRQTRWEKKGIMMSPFVEKHYKKEMQEQHEEHHGVIDTFSSLAERMGKEVVVKSEQEATVEDMQGVDCVVSLGGDHTFLRASALIWDRRIPILGVNTNRDVYTGVLNPHWIDYEKRERHAEQILETMEDDHSVGYEKRTRFLYERVREREEQEEQRVLVLNEVFCAEREVSSASRYCIVKDSIDLGVFKSSGLIVSTGTGSTGWLHAARQLTVQQLEDVQKIIGSLEIDEQTNDQLAMELSDQTNFARDDKRMYFYVREGFSLTRMSEGFCKNMKITSEMLNGKIVIDAWYHRDLSIGDQFKLSSSQDYALRAMELEI